jgi:hypothetical protein
MTEEKKQHSQAYLKANLPAEKLEVLVDSFEKIARTYSASQVKKRSPKKSAEKFIFDLFKSKYFWSLLLAMIAVGGYWLNWRAEITNINVAHIVKEKTTKQLLQRNLNKAVTTARLVIVNQIELCSQTKRTLAELKVARNNSMLDIIALGTGSRYIYNIETQKKVNQILKKIDGIKNICQPKMKNIDNKLRGLFIQLTNLIDKTIDSDNQKLDQLEDQSTWNALLSIFAKGIG